MSIIMPVLNEAANVTACLESLRGQDYSGAFEVIVVDGGSLDETATLARDFEFVRVVEDRGPLGSARQTGLEEARGRFVAMIDGDETACQSWLQHHSGTCARYDASIGPLYPAKPEAFLGHYWEARAILDSRLGPEKAAKRQLTMFGSGNLMVRREAALAIGFDRSLPTAEDGDFSFRFLKQGHAVGYTPSAYVLHLLPLDLPGAYRYFRKIAVGNKMLAERYNSLGLWTNYAAATVYPVSPLFARRLRDVGIRHSARFTLFGLMESAVYLSVLITPTTPTRVRRAASRRGPLVS